MEVWKYGSLKVSALVTSTFILPYFHTFRLASIPVPCFQVVRYQIFIFSEAI
jgi:hypothetical protein